ncbi:serum paraoxonase/arylesterase 1-like [Ylistrum balloti]|uniref:serum paraoxonase/arylesterase 1-like n=1 Tax=Ylistrum balloti TaxID=509963 RepID=UPI002905F536|nr:serum paraoxonase/arylesterase 1-like [Ylistrum balloti]
MAKWPRATHDAQVWNNCWLSAAFEADHVEDYSFDRPGGVNSTTRRALLYKACVTGKSAVRLTVLVALIVQQGVRYWFFMDYHKTRTIIHHRPGPCRYLDGADGGSEDLTVLDNGLTFISSGFCSWTRGRILLFDFNQLDSPSHEVKELRITSSIRDLSHSSFHGMSVWQDSTTGEITLMVINHAGPEDHIEVFKFQKESQTLRHTDSITSPKLTNMNDLVMTSDRTFYITKYTTLRDYLQLELLLMLKYGEILYYDGRDFRSVAQGLHLPNGINVSPDKRYLYVSEFGRKQLKSYRIVDKNLEHVDDLFLNTLVDNIEIDKESGDLWVGCHPIHYHLMEYSSLGPRSRMPSQILKVKTSEGKFTEAVEVFRDSGSELTGSTVASVYQGKMIVGTLAYQLMVCDLVYTD